MFFPNIFHIGQLIRIRHLISDRNVVKDISWISSVRGGRKENQGHPVAESRGLRKIVNQKRARR